MDLRLDSSLASGYKSASQIARVLTQDWISREAYCLSCGEPSLQRTPENTKALDFRCFDCEEPYELKASRHPFGSRVLDGEYRTFRAAIASQNNPNLLLLNYDFRGMEVTDLRAIPRYALSRLSIIPREPLSPTAERRGWQGCTIDLTGLPPAALITVIASGEARLPQAVLKDWRQFDFIGESGRSSRQWLPDILACVRRIPSEEFPLHEVYDFASELRLLHPKNLNVEPKIRQQLQILVAQGLLERVRTGWYRKTGRF